MAKDDASPQDVEGMRVSNRFLLREDEGLELHGKIHQEGLAIRYLAYLCHVLVQRQLYNGLDHSHPFHPCLVQHHPAGSLHPTRATVENAAMAKDDASPQDVEGMRVSNRFLLRENMGLELHGEIHQEGLAISYLPHLCQVLILHQRHNRLDHFHPFHPCLVQHHHHLTLQARAHERDEFLLPVSTALRKFAGEEET
eukprot:CAMPEP_0172783952 /NCGR_PEP_ID=MMETSP1074-20121228/204698_1 /TAXON_ID=2916 /ORGANISM="Ceratium fusus, Strain PA161109" /LENGTH=196 /DNA_ID=CAMNT_0013620951 /DNA_START=329 /DNA_END=916 /DNA_ORIENTATION=-